MKRSRFSSNLWIGVVALAISSIAAAAFALSAQIVGLLLLSTVILAVIDLLDFFEWGRKA